MYDQLQAIEDRYEELGELLSDPEVIADTKRFMALSKEEANTRETVETYRRYKQVVQGISDAEEMLAENLDPQTMIKTLLWKSVVLLVEMKQLYLRVIYLICTNAMLNLKVGKSK